VLTDEDKTTWLSPDDADEATIKQILAEYKAYCCKVRSRDDWRAYYAVQEILMPSINYSYASTVHKAQGSQWLNVIVDINNIRLCRDAVLSSKLQYTAVSRMRNLVQFV
jgi:ATP-dependent exoDNAse (exonuclease V) alpha subunit